MKTKIYGSRDLKLGGSGEGTFEAAFATLDAIDHDGDSYDPGAIGRQDVVISQWNHGSWDSGAGALPVGVGKIFERGNQAIVAGEFDMEDADGEKTYRKLKYLNDKGRNVEWSFALPDFDYRVEDRDGREVRVFTRVSIPEVSPVLLGAGVGTELLSIKTREVDKVEIKQDTSIEFAKQLDDAVEAVESVIGRAKQIRTLREEKGKDGMSRRGTRRLKALLDALHDAATEIDDLLINPNDELKVLADSFAGGKHGD